jgi:hypothetical protein
MQFTRVGGDLDIEGRSQTVVTTSAPTPLLSCRQPLFFNAHKLKIALLDILGAALPPCCRIFTTLAVSAVMPCQQGQPLYPPSTMQHHPVRSIKRAVTMN